VHNNLAAVRGYSYFKVLRPFEVYLQVGVSGSNSSWGSSMIYGNVYKQYTLKRGDQIHSSYTDVYAVIRGVAYRATLAVSERGPFERVYWTPEEVWPVERLGRITANEAARPRDGYPTQFPTIAPGKSVGRGIDSIVEPAKSTPARERRRKSATKTHRK
jgi:hypothetical protein